MERGGAEEKGCGGKDPKNGARLASVASPSGQKKEGRKKMSELKRSTFAATKVFVYVGLSKMLIYEWGGLIPQSRWVGGADGGEEGAAGAFGPTGWTSGHREGPVSRCPCGLKMGIRSGQASFSVPPGGGGLAGAHPGGSGVPTPSTRMAKNRRQKN